MRVKFIITECRPDSIYMVGDEFGMFNCFSLSGAKALKHQIENNYGVKVDYVVFGDNENERE